MDPQTGRMTRKRARSLRERAAPLFGILSDELLLEIFSTLTPEDLASCVSVSHAWRLLAGDGVLWRHHVANEHGRERPPVPSLKAPSAARQLFGELRHAARAALLLGELDYVGFYEETLPGIPDGTIPDGTHTLAFWLRAWPARLSSSDKEAMLMRFADPTVATHTVGLEVLTNYVYLNPPPVPPPGVHPLGQWGGEAYRAMWRDELVDGAPAGRVLRSFRSQLVPGDGPGAADRAAARRVLDSFGPAGTASGACEDEATLLEMTEMLSRLRHHAELAVMLCLHFRNAAELAREIARDADACADGSSEGLAVGVDAPALAQRLNMRLKSEQERFVDEALERFEHAARRDTLPLGTVQQCLA